MLGNLLLELQPFLDVLRLFRYVTVRTALAILTSMIFCFILGPWFIRKIREIQWGQPIREEGPERHKSKEGTPTMGGVLILFSVLLSSLLWANLKKPYIWIALGGTLAYGLLGFLDDWAKVRLKRSLGIRGRTKFILQSLIVAGIGTGLYALKLQGQFTFEVWFPFFKNLHPDFGFFYFIFLWFVLTGASNAVNLTDGLDGLAIGSVMFASAALTGMAYVTGHRIFADYLDIPYLSQAADLTVFCGALLGASIGFLWFNAHPAEIFMGDVGSLALGGALGLITVLLKQELVLPIVGGLFVLEAVSVIIQVASYRLRGKRVFRMTPIHHHFEQIGWPESKIVVRFWIIAFIFALISLTTLKLR